MCGITGFFNTTRKYGNDEVKAIVGTMADTLRHRGPDDSGVWVDDHAGIALGHRRLSILDLSPEGHQPMLSTSGRFVIVFNGEIYNFAEIRNELESQINSTLNTQHLFSGGAIQTPRSCLRPLSDGEWKLW